MYSKFEKNLRLKLSIKFYKDNLFGEYLKKLLGKNVPKEFYNLEPNDEMQRNFEILDEAMRLADNDGLWMEFGVYDGTTINYIARSNPKQHIFGFDSFFGFTEPWCKKEKGDLSLNGIPPKGLEKNISLVVGFFSDELPKLLKDCGTNKVSFLHIDCNTYSTSKTILNNLSDRIVSGTIILFGQYYNYPDYFLHEFKAWEEFCEEYDIEFEYVGTGGMLNEQVIIKVL